MREMFFWCHPVLRGGAGETTPQDGAAAVVQGEERKSFGVIAVDCARAGRGEQQNYAISKYYQW